MENARQILEKFIADLELLLSQSNTPYAKGYFGGKIDAYKNALVLIDTQIVLKFIAEKDDKLNNGGKCE